MKLKLPSGTLYAFTGETDTNGQPVKVCTGSAMGRRDRIPSDRNTPVKLHLQLLPFVDGCYDRWGAYWGGPANVWIATNRADASGAYYANGEGQLVEMFLRANNREVAKQLVRKELPKARFYR